MHIHLPKPLHGWKEFANEIFVIVIGVLIALAFEAGVEQIHWWHKAEDGKERLRVELNGLFGQAAEQATVTPCILAQLDRLQKHLGPDGANEPPMPVDPYPDNLAVLRLPTRPWTNTTWESLQLDGTVAHFPIALQRNLGNAYGRVATIRGLIQQNGDMAGKMLVTSYPGRLAPETRSALLVEIAEQYRRTQYLHRLSAQFMGSMRDVNMQPSDTEVEKVRNSTVGSNTIGYCRDHGLPTNDWKAELAKVPDITKRSL